MSDAQRVQKAVFTPQSGPQQGQAMTVHFNPTSLQLSIANTLGAGGESGQTKQYVTGSSARLTMDLTFDTTDVGTDVRVATQRIAALMEPDEQRTPAIVRFEWGTFVFQGMVQSYQETIDFFSPSGVPLRAKVSLSMARQETVFAGDGAGSGAGGGSGAVLSFSAGAGVTGISAMAGVGDVGRALGAANGLETLRFTSGPVSLAASVSLGGPVAFASGGVGIGFSGGASAGVSGGMESGGTIGGAASAGRSASQGAFAGLRAAPANGSPPALNPLPLFPRADSAGLATDQGAQFGVGGRAKVEGSAGLSADVGVTASLASKIRFDER